MLVKEKESKKSENKRKMDQSLQVNLGTQNGNALHECSRCEAMFRSKDLYEYHRKICYGGQVNSKFSFSG